MAVAFYPASCDERRQQGWPSTIPLLALLGTAAARGSRIELQVYLGADHGFDRANSPIREYPEYRTATEVVPVKGTDRATRQDALTRVPAFLARFLAN